MKIETGVMVMKDGKAWGVSQEDGNSTAHGWVEPEDAPIHSSAFCKKPEDVTHRGSDYTEELRNGKLVHVERRTEVVLMINTEADAVVADERDLWCEARQDNDMLRCALRSLLRDPTNPETRRLAVLALGETILGNTQGEHHAK